jgi:hypothetical protein
MSDGDLVEALGFGPADADQRISFVQVQRGVDTVSKMSRCSRAQPGGSMKSELCCGAVRRASMNARFLVAAMLTAALVAKCGGAGGLPDAGPVGGLDAGEDAGVDAGIDGGVDAGIDAGHSAGFTPGCSVTVSGGSSTTSGCTVAAFTTLSTGGSIVSINVPGVNLPDGGVDLAGTMTFSMMNGALVQGSLTTVTPNPQQLFMGTIWVAGGKVWEQIFESDADGGSADKMGSWSLNLTSVTPASIIEGSQFFTIHGTGVAQLLSGLNSNVTFSATF